MCFFLSNTLRKFACCKVNWDSSVKICVPAYKNTAVGIMSSSTRYTLTVSHILCGKSLPFLHQLAPLSLFHRWDYWSSYTANAEDWTLNIQEMRSHSGSRNAVCHGSHNLSWVVSSRFDLWGPMHTSVRTFHSQACWVDLLFKQTNRFHWSYNPRP